MELFKELVSSDIGLLSLFTIAFIIVMAVWFWFFFQKHMNEEEQASPPKA
ncbi:MAG: DUF3149 domain-containing protein [Zoogloeaceae bacterium]|jgi:hypothetical protein|nr:DUF3149 domain-containing protein [Zoogloeaceae bacterium]